MKRVYILACAIPVICACSQSDTFAPKSAAMRPNDRSSRSVSPVSRAASDLAAAKAAEVAALHDIEMSIPPDKREFVLSGLTSPHSVLHAEAKELNDSFNRYYDARTNRQREEHRYASVVDAAGRGGISVVVALAQPPSGAIAAVLRRRLVLPSDVIVLAPDATAETLGAAFAAFDESRARFGDDLLEDQIIGVQQAHATSIDLKTLKRFGTLLDRLRNARTRSLEGIGIARAIDLRSLRLQSR